MPATILVCPLSWGLGHATRCIPVIRQFINNNCRVVIAASGVSLALLQQEFGPAVEYEEFPGKEIRYSQGRFFILKLSMQLPAFLFSIYKEYRWIQKQVKRIKPDIIISDNRYGARSKSAVSVFITHQLFVRMPPKLRLFQRFVNNINHIFISAFDHCWVPDVPEAPGLSGDLSHYRHLPFVQFAGLLSRFSAFEKYKAAGVSDQLPRNFFLVILSGPEPQRTILEEKLKEALGEEVLVGFRGIPGKMQLEKTGNHFWFDHGNPDLMGWCLENCRAVISRSGYTTLMDMAVFGKKAVLIPTPGQTEQEYLAVLFNKNNYTVSLDQKDISGLKDALVKCETLSGVPEVSDSGLLHKCIDKLLQDTEKNQ
ncbi:MAG: hypothetical protein K0B37_11725 [Bacteroidales bacterium]|nr:hypothetical protein [Bacteroidales bacterium]